jgi:hypothetical protein
VCDVKNTFGTSMYTKSVHLFSPATIKISSAIFYLLELGSGISVGQWFCRIGLVILTNSNFIFPSAGQLKG